MYILLVSCKLNIWQNTEVYVAPVQEILELLMVIYKFSLNTWLPFCCLLQEKHLILSRAETRAICWIGSTDKELREPEKGLEA